MFLQTLPIQGITIDDKYIESKLYCDIYKDTIKYDIYIGILEYLLIYYHDKNIDQLNIKFLKKIFEIIDSNGKDFLKSEFDRLKEQLNKNEKLLYC
jgi:hypothetical protein